MSVIIRLQNLPWSASALDIRTFFSGLSIPEGGVHIVGGELGDAFIAFSTDEDARLAIQRDSGRLKDTMVKLLLSSRSEMHKVIETARQRVSVMQVPAPAPAVAPAALPSHLVASAAGRPMNVPSPNSASTTVAQNSPAYAPPFSTHSYAASSFDPSTFVAPILGTANLSALNMGATTGANNFNSANFSATNLGSNNVGSSNFGASNIGASNLTAPNLNLTNFNASHLGVSNNGTSNFGGPNISTSHFSTPNFGTANPNFTASNNGTSNFGGPNLGTSNYGVPNRGQPLLGLPAFGSPGIHSLGVSQQVDKEPPPQPAVIEPPAPVVAAAPSDQQHSKRSADSRSRHGRSRSKSRDREKKSRGRRDRSRSKDRSHRRRDRSRSRDRDRRDRRRDRRSRSKDRSRDRDSRKSRESKIDEVVPEQPAETPVLTRGEGLPTRWSNNPFKDVSVDTPTNALNQPSAQLNVQLPTHMPANPPAIIADQSPPEEDNNFASLDNNTYSRLQELGNRRNPNAFQDSNDSETRNDSQSDFRDKYEDRRNRHDHRDRNEHRDKREFNRNVDSQDSCIKVSGLAPQTGYGEVRRFFSGYYIPNNGLKMINDEFGKRTGVVYIKFARTENKIAALKCDGRSLSGQRVSVAHLDDDEYDCAIDNKRPQFKPRTFHEPRQEMSHDGDRQFENYEQTNEHDSEPELQNYNILFLDDMPPTSKEYDVVKIFSDYSLVSISMFPSKQYRKMMSAFVHFVNADDAKLALLNRMKHMIGRKVIPVTPCKQEDFEIARNENMNAIEKSNANMESNSNMETNSNMDNNSNMESNSIEETNSNEDNDSNGNVPTSAPVSRDPRQRQMAEAKKPDSGNGPSFLFQPNIAMPGSNPRMPPSLMQGQRMPWLPDMHINSPSLLNMPNMSMNNSGFNKPFEDTSSFDCVHLRSLPPDTSDRNILDFFSEVGVIPTRIHIMLNSSGEQSGDCFCEFASVHDARKAVTKNGSILGPHTIEVELCSERRVQDALQRPLHGNNMFNGPGRREPFNGPPGGMRGGFGGRGMGPMGRGGFMPRGRGMPLGMRPMRGNFRGGPGGLRFPPNQRFNNFGNKPDNTLGEPEIENFGAPGCYVSLENVPFKAGVDEILEFFSNYDLTASDIIRRFNEKGMPTGDARVNFRTPEDAREAVEKLHFKMIRDRRISLQLLN